MLSVKKISLVEPFRFAATAGAVIALLACLALAHSAPPRIDRIVPTNNVGHPQVEIHFGSEANRTYVLQYNSNSFATTNWVNLATGLALPFTNHWIFNDTRTNKARFYRLRATP